MSLAYKNFVEARCKQDPALLKLHAFLSASTISLSSEQIILLNFYSDGRDITRMKLAPSQISAEVCDKPHSDGEASDEKLGQILVIENISRDTMAELGSSLSIDPMFFASHIHSAWRDLEALPPKFRELPSRTKAQHFATFTYHRSLVFPEIDPQDYKLLRLLNIQRKVIVLPAIQGRRIGLAQHCCSVFVAPERETSWFGLVLVDSPMKDAYLSIRDKQDVFIQTPCTPLFGDTHDGLPITCGPNINSPRAEVSVLEELLDSWESATHHFSQTSLSLKELSYHPLRLIAAEWVNYIEVIRVSLRNNSSPPSGIASSAGDLERFQGALISASSWPRRVASSTVSLRRSTLFIKQHSQPEDKSTYWEALQDDYDYLSASLIEQGKQMQATVLSVTAFLQLLESRRASLETKQMSRLTVLALTFVPLSFVSGLFSMNEVFSPGGPLFWMYFAVATPVLIFVFVVAKSAQWRSSFVQRLAKGFLTGRRFMF